MRLNKQKTFGAVETVISKILREEDFLRIHHANVATAQPKRIFYRRFQNWKTRTILLTFITKIIAISLSS